MALICAFGCARLVDYERRCDDDEPCEAGFVCSEGLCVEDALPPACEAAGCAPGCTDTDLDRDDILDCIDECVDADLDGSCLIDDCDDTALTGSTCVAGCSTFYADHDGDGFGAAEGGTVSGCVARDGFVASATDCADAPEADDGCGGAPGASCNPSVSEVCGDGIDNDCDGAADCADSACAGATCDDGVFCNGSDTCGGRACAVHSGDPCSAGNACNNSCDEAADNCLAVAGTPCTDDLNPCTNDECDGGGACTHSNNTASCDDDNVCNGTDTCSGGTCSQHSGTVSCGDGNPCTSDGSCNPATGCPAKVNNTASCNDGNVCNGSDTCSGGTCSQHSGTVSCNDGNPCTNDGSCNPSTGCPAKTYNTASCNADNNACTVGDACNGAGSCVAGAVCPTSGEYCDVDSTCRYPALVNYTFGSSTSSPVCSDMGTIFFPPNYFSEYRIFGPVGASFTKYNRRTACGGSWQAAESGTIPSSGHYDLVIGISTAYPCSDTAGFAARYDQYASVNGINVSAPSVTFYNSTCTSAAFVNCSGAASYCY